MTDAEIAAALSEILSDGRRVLRKYLIADEHDRKSLLLGLYREGSRPAQAMAELVEVLDVDADARRRVTRILGEIEARTTRSSRLRRHRRTLGHARGIKLGLVRTFDLGARATRGYSTRWKTRPGPSGPPGMTHTTTRNRISHNA